VQRPELGGRCSVSWPADPQYVLGPDGFKQDCIATAVESLVLTWRSRHLLTRRRQC